MLMLKLENFEQDESAFEGDKNFIQPLQRGAEWNHGCDVDAQGGNEVQAKEEYLTLVELLKDKNFIQPLQRGAEW